MAAQKAKSKKHSSGNKPRPLKGFTLYLCNNVDFDELAVALDRAKIRYQRHRKHFAGWAPDQELLRLVGEKHWILVTTDQRQRTKHLERYQIVKFKVREFVFTEGDWGKRAIIDAILKAKNKMRSLCRSNPGPFIAAISKDGSVRLRSLHGTENETKKKK